MTACCAISGSTAAMPATKPARVSGPKSRFPGRGIAGGRRIEQVGRGAYKAPMTQFSSVHPLPPVALASSSHPGTFPDPDSCWHAVQQRNRAFNGRFWFSVKTTGVYCLPSCAARPPLRKNVAFHASPEAAEAAGFRPCKRCKPHDWQAELGLSKPVARACALFDAADIDSPPSLNEVARTVGVTANTLSKRFVAELGVT